MMNLATLDCSNDDNLITKIADIVYNYNRWYCSLKITLMPNVLQDVVFRKTPGRTFSSFY